MARKITATDEKKIRQMFAAHELYYEWEIDENFVKILIEWGDWKHEHGNLDYLMEKIGFVLKDEEVTEEDGSDTYSSIHHYVKA